MFEKASRMKLRFPSSVGSLTLEDVWDLPLVAGRSKGPNLDDMAKTLNRELKNSDTESFVLKQSKPNEELALKFEIVKHIIDVRLKEQEVVESAKKTRERKQQILAIMAEKETNSLKDKSLDELKALLEAL